MKRFAVVLLALALVGVGAFSPFSSTSTALKVPPGETMPRGLVVQESGVTAAVQYGVSLAAKGWPANRGWAAIDQELILAEQHDVQLMVGLMFQNETYGGAPSALPAHWDKVCWSGVFAGCGPNYANPVTRGQIYRLVRNFAERYDGHPQIAGVMAAMGDDRERRFCKDPSPGSACRIAYEAAGLTPSIWKRHISDLAWTYADAFKLTPVLCHFSGFGYANWELDRDVKVAVAAGLGLMSSGLYPQNCPGNSSGDQCNPISPLLTDWLVMSVYRNSFVAAEQSLGYTGDEAALAWLNAVTHGADQIHAQRQTMASSVGSEWRESTEYMLIHPEAAIWVVRDAEARPCKGTYCPEEGNWNRNVSEVSYGVLGFDVAPGYMGLVARRGPVTLTTSVPGPVQVIVVLANGERLVGTRDSGENIYIGTTEYIHRIEVRPGPAVGVTMTPTRTATQQAPATATATRTPEPTLTPTSTPTATPEAMGPPSGWTVKGKFGYFGQIDLIIRPFWE